MVKKRARKKYTPKTKIIYKGKVKAKAIKEKQKSSNSSY